MEKQEDKIHNEQEEKLLEETFSIHSQRKNMVLGMQLLKSVRIIAWYNFVVKSGIELNTIRLKPRGISGKDTYRRWNHWKNGNGKVEGDDLNATELKVPGSRQIFNEGPDGAPLWKALDISNNAYYEASNYHDNFISIPENDFVNFSEDDYISLKIDPESIIGFLPDRTLKFRKLIFKDDSYWHKLTRAILQYRQCTSLDIIPLTSKDNAEITTIKRILINRSRVSVIKILSDLEFEAKKQNTPHKTVAEIINRLYLTPFKNNP